MALNTDKRTILLVDDDRAVRAVVKIFLKRAGYDVLTAADGVEGLSVFNEHRKSIALLLTDLIMPNMNGLELADRVSKLDSELPVLFISGNMEQAHAGWSCVAKPFTSGELVGKVRQVLAPRELRRANCTAGTEEQPPVAPLSPLTKREHEVLQLICQGYSSKRLGDKLGISFKTAVCHRTRILQKMGVHETASLVRFAVRAGLVDA